MVTLTRRQFSILRTLQSRHGRISSEHLSKIIGSSSKTIRKDILDMREALDAVGARIDSKTGSGYLLEIENADQFDTLMNHYINDNQETVSALPPAHQSAHLILRRLLSTEGYLKIQDLADALYSTRAMITQQMHIVRQLLNRFDLTVTTRAKYGMQITGSELSIRNCIIYESEFCRENQLAWQDGEPADFAELDGELEDEIEDIIVQEREKIGSFDISYPNLRRLVMVINLIRLRSPRHPVVFTERQKEQLERKTSCKLAHYIAIQCERRCGIPFCSEDILFLTVWIAGSRSIISYSRMHNRANYFTHYDIAAGLMESLCRINHFKKLGQDNVLIEDLALHFIPMFTRVEYKIILPMNNNFVKRVCSGGLELSVQTARYLKEHHQITLNEDEILYLIYLISPTYGRYRPLVRKRRILIISDISINVGNTLAERFMRNFSAYIESIQVAELYDLKQLDLSEIDLIYTTVNQKYFRNLSLKIPVVEIRNFFTEKDKNMIRNYLISAEDHFTEMKRIFSSRTFFSNIQARTKQELLETAAQRLCQSMPLDDQFGIDLICRDQICSAEMGENMARMRTLQSHGPDTFIAVFILEKPMIWDLESVQILFIWHHGTDPRHHVYEESGYIGNILKTAFAYGDGAIQLLQNPTLDCLESILKQAVGEIKSLQIR